MSKLVKLFGCLSVAALLGATTSCSSDKEDAQESIQMSLAKSADYKVFSGSKNFVTSFATRGIDVNGNMWETLPAYPTNAERAGILAYIATKPEGVKWPGYKKFFIQHVGGANKQYSYVDFNGAKHTNINGTTSMELLTVTELDGTRQHVYNFNCGKCENPATHDCALMTNGLKSIDALNEYSSTMIENCWRVFYWEGNYYIGIDFRCDKNDAKTNPAVAPDGCFDDWVVKIIPADGDDTPEETEDPETPDTPEHFENEEVEVNLSVNDKKEEGDYIASKLSIHVRAITDAEIFIPVPENFYCDADDMDITLSHKDDIIVYNVKKETVSFEVAGQKITLNINYSKEGIKVTTEGVNKTAIDYCKALFKDGITFEVWNYYQNSTREELKKYFDKSTVSFTNNPETYINAFAKLGETQNPWDCKVAPTDNGYKITATKVYNKVYTFEK